MDKHFEVDKQLLVGATLDRSRQAEQVAMQVVDRQNSMTVRLGFYRFYRVFLSLPAR